MNFDLFHPHQREKMYWAVFIFFTCHILARFFRCVYNQKYLFFLRKTTYWVKVQVHGNVEKAVFWEKHTSLWRYIKYKNSAKITKIWKPVIVYCTCYLTGGGRRGQSSWLVDVKVEQVTCWDRYKWTYVKIWRFKWFLLFVTIANWERSKFVSGDIYLHCHLWRNR